MCNVAHEEILNRKYIVIMILEPELFVRFLAPVVCFLLYFFFDGQEREEGNVK